VYQPWQGQKDKSFTDVLGFIEAAKDLSALRNFMAAPTSYLESWKAGFATRKSVNACSARVIQSFGEGDFPPLPMNCDKIQPLTI
jgi:hypothetical protein